MKGIIKAFFLLFSLLITSYGFADNLNESCKAPGFMKNLGQFSNSSDKVHFKLSGQKMEVFLTDEGLSYVFDNSEDSTNYRMDMTLMGDPNFSDIETSDPLDCHFNYYKGDQALQGLRKYRSITVKNLYPGIHWKIYTEAGKNKGLKYDFIVEPGVNPNQLKWQYSGANQIRNKKDNLIIETPLGRLKEGELYCYTQTNSDRKVINSQYERRGRTFRLSLAKEQFEDTLVVDPPVDWATFFGGSNDEIGKAIRTDKNGNTYIAGRTQSTDLPTPSGSAVPNNGQYDIFISKFDTAGKQKWVSIVGGSSDDDLGNMRISQHGHIYFGGKTGSHDFPTKDAYQSSKAGNEDAYVVKMDLKGGMIWSTYFGGNDREILSGLDINQKGDVYITGLTESSSGISTSGAFQTNQNSSWDGYLTKFDSSGSVEWSTYYGGDELDNPKAVATDDFGHVYLAGITRSSTQMGTAGSHQPTYDGSQTARNYNGFLGKFDSAGKRAWGTYFGKNGSCISTGVTTDKEGNAFLTGRGGGAPTKNAHQDTVKGGREAYFSKFSPSGNLIFSTFYGGSANEHYVNHVKMVSDNMGRLIACGRTKSNDLPLKNPIQSNYGGNEDGFIVAYDSTGTMEFSTYWGGAQKDDLFNTALSPEGHLLFAGTSASNAFGVQNPSSSYYSQSSNNGGSDFYLLRLDPFCKLDAGFTLQDSKSICVGDSVLVTDTSGFRQRKWSINGDFMDSTSESLYFKFTESGTYKIEMAVSQGDCSGKTEKTVTVGEIPSKPQLNVDGRRVSQDSIFVCKGNSFQLSDDQNNINRAWYIGEQLVDSTSQSLTLTEDNIDVLPLKLVHSNKGCADSIMKSLKVTSKPPRPTLKVIEGNDTMPFQEGSFCVNETISFQAGNQGVLKREWVYENEVKDSGVLFESSFKEGNNQLTIHNYSKGCKVSENFGFTVNPIPPKPSVQEFSHDTLMSTVSGDHYKWFRNDSLLNKDQQLIEAPGKGEYRVVVSNENCFSDTSAGFQFNPTSVSDLALSNLKVYPNPSDGLFKVEPGFKNKEQVTLQLFSSQGKLLRTVVAKGNETVRFRRQASGVYWVKINSGNAIATKKVVIVDQ